METFSNKSLIVLSFLITTINIYSRPNPPQPTPGPPPPIELSIDGGLFIMICFSILFGLYKLNKYKNKLF